MPGPTSSPRRGLLSRPRALARQWVVERTFAWIMKNRRFARDYEQRTDVAETLIVIAACATLVRRWAMKEHGLLKHALKAAVAENRLYLCCRAALWLIIRMPRYCS